LRPLALYHTLSFDHYSSLKVERKIKTLSGGQKSRIAFAKLYVFIPIQNT
jgi:ATPase subunit of ABC transporter with duplicated ATPase domains